MTRLNPKERELAMASLLSEPIQINPNDMELSNEDPCWDGYQQIGMKMKDGKKVPNCVPIDKEK
jgi:hypothetical protein